MRVEDPAANPMESGAGRAVDGLDAVVGELERSRDSALAAAERACAAVAAGQPAADEDIASIEAFGRGLSEASTKFNLDADAEARVMLEAVLTAVEEKRADARRQRVFDALLAAAMDGQNYRPANFRKGRADWIPQKALAALRELRPAGYSRRLLPLLNESKDGRIRAHALHTIEILEKKSLKAGRPFAERAAAWNATLTASR